MCKCSCEEPSRIPSHYNEFIYLIAMFKLFSIKTCTHVSVARTEFKAGSESFFDAIFDSFTLYECIKKSRRDDEIKFENVFVSFFATLSVMPTCICRFLY